MNWHSRLIIKTAAAKSKIQKYGIVDPSVKFFIYTYENALPWDQIDKVKQKGGNAEAAIQDLISSNLMSELQTKITRTKDDSSKDNNYLAYYDIQGRYEEARRHPPVPADLEAAYQIYVRDPAGAEERIRGVVNKDKQERFHEWWNYVNEEDMYKNSPAFKYSVLKPIIDSSPKDKEVAPLPLNPEALAYIWDEITVKGVNQMNVLKKYRKQSAKVNEERAKSINVSEEGEKEEKKWVHIPSKIKDPHNYKINKAMLQGFSQGTSWCIAGETMSNTHLSKGDFWLYLEDNRAVVAIRLDNNEKVMEIRGHQHPDSEGWTKLKPYWKEVTSFLSKSNFNYTDNAQYKKLKRIVLMNDNLVRGSDNYNTLVDMLRTDHKAYEEISDENRVKFPEFLDIAAEGYRKEVNEYLIEIEKPGLTEAESFTAFENFQGYFNKLPPEINNVLGDMQPRIIDAHKQAFGNNPFLFPEFPIEIQKQFTKEEKIGAWRKYIADDPYRFNDDRIGDIKESLNLNMKGLWLDKIKTNPLHLDYMPKAILKEFGPNELAPILLEDFAQFPVSQRYMGVYDKLNRIEPFVQQGVISRDQIVTIFRNSLRTNPEWIDAIPPQYKEEVMGGQNVAEMVEVIRDKAIRSIQTPDYFKSLSPDVQNAVLEQYGLDVGNAFAKNAERYLGMMHQFWVTVPESLRLFWINNPDKDTAGIVEQTATFYAQQLAQNMSEFDKIFPQIPSEIQGKVWSKLAFGRNWYKKAKTEKEYRDYLEKALGVGKYQTERPKKKEKKREPQHSMDMHDEGDDGW